MSARYVEAARIYQEAIEQGFRGIVAVMDGLGVSHATAARDIRRAREAGLVSSTDRDRPHRKLFAIAEEIGVEYDTLLAAFNKHTGGDLRMFTTPGRADA